MQTFLPFSSFAQSAKVLDRQRLGKQRVEVLQILNALFDHNCGWQNHPAVRMWRGHSFSLCQYGFAICDEWVSRGYKDTCSDKIVDILMLKFPDYPNTSNPSWLGDPDFHASHRAALLAKNPQWYGRFGWSEEPKIEYVWPSP